MNLTLDQAVAKVFNTPELYAKVKLSSKKTNKLVFKADPTKISDKQKKRIVDSAGGVQVQTEMYTFK